MFGHKLTTFFPCHFQIRVFFFLLRVRARVFRYLSVPSVWKLTGCFQVVQEVPVCGSERRLGLVDLSFPSELRFLGERL